MFASQLGFSQAIENGAIFEVAGGTTIKGELLPSDSIFKVKLGNGSVVSLNKYGIKKALMPMEVNLFSNGKYNFKEGIFYNFETGLSIEHYSFNFIISKSIRPDLEVGLGIGYHYNSLSFPSGNGFGWIDINSVALFANGKYYIDIKKSSRPYLKAAIGYSNNSPTWNVTQVNDGIMLQAGMGIAFASRKNAKWYLEIAQYSLNAKGKANSFTNSFQPNSNVIDFDVWFNKIVFNVGFLFGS
jgi:hypothetical protein